MKNKPVYMKLSHKANAYVLNHVLKINPKVPKTTTYDQAYEILMENWNMDGSIETTRKNLTKFKLFKEDEIIKIYEWNNIFNEGMWDFDIIFRTVLEDIIKNKLFKPAKKTRKKATK